MVFVPMSEQARITIPTGSLAWFSDAMTDAGLSVLDTGERVTTEDGVGAEAVIHVARFETGETGEASITEPPLTDR